MNRYQASMPRAVMMIAAVAMSALTLGLSVLPAKLASDGYEARLQAASRASASATTDVARGGAPIVVYGVREQNTAFEPVRHDLPSHKQAS